ncbi:flavocytochrome c [Limosilactobacillus vaginalis]|jgi:fumarate reductase flavoprotein subunit|uniref:Flavocytochrome c n=1 Tax=Limosilactobacillus vaginalis TaxID=1633 RepID=A0AAW5WRZ3_9LACO|nr:MULTISPECIES: flavocytochrome c [Limosilactobacillus]MCI6852086.1 flavocytochrome c [Limosilactobacillus vaginalis]MCZ3667180.1 flavocytochrome c [Limosilactobacillus vaginalis]MCZ3746393.1 flavocytochrome c [Limosilactobacillus vaginalis]MCZ3751341.1 flavocytochrome c [Limosilactobacillus vaginalis]MCZ3753151.1 flavocytochrome c [Limosilactobacillus vaginalis]
MAEFQPTSVGKLENDYDVVIIGSGGTGLSAAIQANELGMKVAVLEKEEELGGNTNRASSGMNAAETNVQLHHGVIDNVADFYHETYKDGGRLNDKDMLGYFVYHTAPAIDWLADHDIKLDDITITGGMSKKRTHRPASMAPIGGFLVKSLLKVVAQEDIPVFNKTKVTELRRADDGRVNGVKVDADGITKIINAKAVILATGGFGASKEYIKRFRPDLESYKTTNQPGATGDGLKLAENVGAELMQMNLVQVHPTVQQDNPHVYLIGEAVRGEGAILVNAEGKRFVNELNTRKIVSNAITALPEHSAYLILDQGIRDHVKAIEFYDKVGLVVHGETIEDLAKKINVDPSNLKQTVATWNQAVENHDDAEFGRTTGMDRGITNPGFFAIHIAPAIHYTMGGIHITPKTQVLDGNGDIIKGLFAAGEVAGGLHGNNRVGGNSIAETIVFGRQAGQQVALYARSL